MWKEFKEFIMRGNVMDMAVGIIIGAAFGKIVTSFVNDVLMPPLGLMLGKARFHQPFYFPFKPILYNPGGSQEGRGGNDQVWYFY